MLEHENEGFSGEAFAARGEVDHSLLFLFEVVCEQRLEVERPAG